MTANATKENHADCREQAIAITNQTHVNSQNVIGSLCWDDDALPISEATIAVYDEATPELGPIMIAASDSRGHFTLQPTNGQDFIDNNSARKIVITDKNNQILHTHTLPTNQLRDQTVRLNLAVSGANRPPAAKQRHPIRPTIPLGNLRLDKSVWETLKPNDLHNLARLNMGQVIPSRAKRKLERLCPDLIPDQMARKSLCTTEVVLALYEMQRQKQWTGYVGNELDTILTGFWDSGFAQESYESANFVITYQTSGTQAVDPDKSAMDIVSPGSNPPVVLDTIPAGGAGDPPTYVRLIAFWLERALANYINPPFSLRNPAAGGKSPVYVNHGSSGSASPSGSFSIHWDLSPELVCAVSVHELFHMVQFEYGLSYSHPWRQSMMEGGATLSEDSSADEMNRYLFEASTSWNGDGVLVKPERSLISASYDCALFWRYIAEQHSTDITEPHVGVETYRKLIEVCSVDGCTTAAIEKAIRQLPWYEGFYQFRYLDPTQLELSRSETTLGNFALALYLKDLGVNVPSARFDFLEDEENIGFDEVLNTQWPGAGTAVSQLVSVALTASDNLTNGANLNYANSVSPFSSRYYEVQIDTAVSNVDVTFAAGASLTSLVFQIVQIDEDGQVRDIHRTDKTSYTKRITNRQGGKVLDRLLVAVTGGDSSGSFNLIVGSAAAASDVMVTRWNSSVTNEYEMRSRYWTWVSPDIWVDNDGNGLADSVVYFNHDNKLTIRLHNKGNLDAAGIQVDFWYQDATGGLHPGDWLPVRNKSGTSQQLSGLTLAAGATDTWSVDWSPVASGSSKHFCLRAVVFSPGDANTDNKRVLSNFGNVRVRPTFVLDIDLIRRHLELFSQVVIPRLLVRYPPSSDSTRPLKITPITPNIQQKLLQPDQQVIDRIRFVINANTLRVAPVAPSDGLANLPPAISRVTRGPVIAYPPKDALPPGVWGRPLVTVAHEADGEAVGGFTAAIIIDEDA